MHPTVMTMIATDRAVDMRCAADERRRGRQARHQARRLLTLRMPRRAARFAHA